MNHPIHIGLESENPTMGHVPHGMTYLTDGTPVSTLAHTSGEVLNLKFSPPAFGFVGDDPRHVHWHRHGISPVNPIHTHSPAKLEEDFQHEAQHEHDEIKPSGAWAWSPVVMKNNMLDLAYDAQGNHAHIHTHPLSVGYYTLDGAHVLITYNSEPDHTPKTTKPKPEHTHRNLRLAADVDEASSDYTYHHHGHEHDHRHEGHDPHSHQHFHGHDHGGGHLSYESKSFSHLHQENDGLGDHTHDHIWEAWEGGRND